MLCCTISRVICAALLDSNIVRILRHLMLSLYLSFGGSFDLDGSGRLSHPGIGPVCQGISLLLSHGLMLRSRGGFCNQLAFMGWFAPRPTSQPKQQGPSWLRISPRPIQYG